MTIPTTKKRLRESSDAEKMQTIKKRKTANSSNSKAKLEGFWAANNKIDDTDFTIFLGQHEWKVHVSVLSKHSTFFKGACSNGMKESQDRQIRLHDDDPWHFGRVLLFMYTGMHHGKIDTSKDNGLSPAYRRYSRSYTSISLEELVDQNNYLTEANLQAEQARTEKDIDHALWHLADKYDMKFLRECVADELVLKSLFWTAEARSLAIPKSIQHDFFQAYELIEDSLHEMPQLESSIVKVLLRCKFSELEAVGSTTQRGVEDRLPQRSEENEEFWKQIKVYLSRNGRLALGFASGLEEMLNKSSSWYKWTKKRSQDLDPK